MSELQEIWKPVYGYEEYYEVSNLGNIRTIERFVVLPTHSYLKKQKMLTQFKDGRGYNHVKLYDGKGKPKSFTTHKVVAITFLDNPECHPEINHKDGNKLNNNLDNLEWSSRSDNIKHSYAIRDVRSYSGENAVLAKLTENQVIEIREAYEKGEMTRSQLSKKYGVKYNNIDSIIKRKTWKHV
jgi:hypothetical protein